MQANLKVRLENVQYRANDRRSQLLHYLRMHRDAQEFLQKINDCRDRHLQLQTSDPLRPLQCR